MRSKHLVHRDVIAFESRVVKISKAQIYDLPNLAGFARLTYAQAFAEDLEPSVLQHHLSVNMSEEKFEQMFAVDRFYQSYKESTLVGFAQVGLVDPAYADYVQDFDRNGAELKRLYVRRDLQSQGVGSSLIQWAMQDLPLASAEAVYLTTWETNQRAQKLYGKHCFNLVGRIPEYAADGSLVGHEHIMMRRQ